MKRRTGAIGTLARKTSVRVSMAAAVDRFVISQDSAGSGRAMIQFNAAPALWRRIERGLEE
jgi:hypothetical protein